MNFQEIYQNALAAAVAAEREFMAQYGEPMYCGFAWVYFPSARSQFVNWCKKNGIGRKNWRKGYDIWNPAGNFTQSMDIKEVGAEAFAAVLNAAGIECYMESRAD